MKNEVTVHAMMTPYGDLKLMAETIHKSRLWAGFTSPEQITALMLLCQSEGLHPMKAVTQYDIIQGRPAMKSEAQLAKFYQRGGRVEWMQRDASVCEAKFFSQSCAAGVVVKWTMDDAKKAGLDGKENYRKFPRQMLSARVQAEGVQIADPGAALGINNTEEATDLGHTIADNANHLSAELTGADTEAEPMAPLPAKEDKDWKKLRAELNKTLKACATLQAFRDACKAFQTANGGKAIWLERTRHNRQVQSEAGLHDETFADLAQDHQNRLTQAAWFEGPVGVKTWIEKMKGCSLKDFPDYIKSFRNEVRLQIMDVEDALHDKALSLGFQSYPEAEGEDNEVYEATE